MDRSRHPGLPALVVLLILAFATVSGCATRTQPVRQPVPPLPGPRAVLEPLPARDQEADPEPSERAAAGEEEPSPQAVEPGEEVAVEGALPEEEGEVVAGEPVTESPLDELDVAQPELTPEEEEKSRDLVEGQTPTFDIPIETNEKVLGWVERYTHQFRKPFHEGLVRSGRYMEMFRRIFAEEGLPQDLVYMAAVESGYKTTAYSRAKARGIFQFIASTGKLYGLRVDSWVDERSDPEKSARAAARYMKVLYEEFGDWHLALAAYNAGEGKIRRAIAGSGTRDFWKIAQTRYIRTETKNHVPAVLAAAILSKSPEKYGLDYVPEAPMFYDTIQVEGAADLQVLARCAGTDVETLRQLNPALRRQQTPPGARTDVRVPLGTADHASLALSAIPAGERVLYVSHKVKRGDTLSLISRRYGVEMAAIQQVNHMGRKTMIRVNQVLRIPTSSDVRAMAEAAPAEAARAEIVTYRVRSGDTLTRIAKRHGTTPQRIAAQNGFSVNRVLKVGDRLRVPRGASGAVEGTKSSGESVHHTVRRGDTLSGIANLYETTVRMLCSLNSIHPSTVLLPGVKLTVGYR